MKRPPLETLYLQKGLLVKYQPMPDAADVAVWEHTKPRRFLEVLETGYYLVFVGRLDSRRGIDLLIYAKAYFSANDRLLLVGPVAPEIGVVCAA